MQRRKIILGLASIELDIDSGEKMYKMEKGMKILAHVYQQTNNKVIKQTNKISSFLSKELQISYPA